MKPRPKTRKTKGSPKKRKRRTSTDLKKIKQFNLPLRVKEILRRARKNSLDMDALGLSDELQARSTLAAFHAKLSPAVLYNTYDLETELPPGVREPRTLATSVGAATLFSEGDKKTAPVILSSHQDQAADLLKIHLDVTLEECAKFIQRLIALEAGKEQCELSAMRRLGDLATTGLLLKKMDATRIGVQATKTGIVPNASFVFALGWLAQKRTKTKAQ